MAVLGLGGEWGKEIFVGEGTGFLGAIAGADKWGRVVIGLTMTVTCVAEFAERVGWHRNFYSCITGCLL
jgi:hypothetical protein